MQTCVRVKRRFGRSAVAVPPRDRSKHSNLETGRFFHKTCQFSVIAASGAIFARYRSAPFFKHSFRKSFRFPANPTRFVIARRARAPDAAIFDETICRPETNYGCAERNRTINKERESGMKQRIPFFVIGISSCFVLPCFGAGCHTFGFQIATAATRPRNDTKIGTFLFENGRFSFMRLFFAQCRSASFFKRFVPEIVAFSNVSFRKLLRFPANPTRFVIARRAQFLRPTRQS